MKPSSLVVVLAVAIGSFGPATAAEPAKSAEPAGHPQKSEAKVLKESAWTWGSFLTGDDKAAVERLVGDNKHGLNVYRVDRVVPVRGTPAVNLTEGATVIRVETAGRFAIPEKPATKGLPTLLFEGVPQHLEYTSKAQRDGLNATGRAEVPASKDTIVVVIPIRKSAAWWALPHDERHAHFRQTKERDGHTAIGAPYVDRIYRKLYHTRYGVESRDHDFITYFEFTRDHEADFKKLCAALRDTSSNPEWAYVDREYEIWMTKVE